MPLETVGEEIERLGGERRRYELTLAATPESERDRRAHLQEWVDRRTARINELYDLRPLGLWPRIALGCGALACAGGSWAAESFWPTMGLAALALFLADRFRRGSLERRIRKWARTLRPRSHWEKPPNSGS